jgi:hypothetical protein
MLSRERRPEVDQEVLRLVLRELHAAREALRQMLEDEDLRPWEREGLQSASRGLERAIALVESYVD